MLSWAKFLVDIEVEPAFAAVLASEISSLDESLLRVHASDGVIPFLTNLDIERVGVWLIAGPATVRAALDTKPGWCPEVCSTITDGTDADLPELESLPNSLAFEVEPLFAIDRSGHATSGGRRSSRPVWERGVAASLVEIGVDLKAVPVPGIRIPWVMTAKGPAGAKASHWVIGGVQAAGVEFSQTAGQVAFGFGEGDDFAEWIKRAADLEPEEAWFRTGFGQRDQGPTRERTPALHLAYSIVSGDLNDATAALGLGTAPAKRPARHADDAASMLASAIGIIALSRHVHEKRKASARLLVALAHVHAERIAEKLAHEDSSLVDLKAFNAGSVRKRRARLRKEPALAMESILGVLARLLAIFAKDGAR